MLNKEQYRMGIAVTLALTGATVVCLTVITGRRKRRAIQLTPHVAGKVRISRDNYGIPHIEAENRDDAIFGLGYAAASDRLWQMDLVRRMASGRLCEITGPDWLESDRLMRLLGMERIARQLSDQIDDDTRTALDAYAAGVNYRIQHGRLPIEFRLARIRPEPWSAADSLLIYRLVGWGLCGSHVFDLVAHKLRGIIGDDWVDALYSESYPGDPPMFPDFKAPEASQPTVTEILAPFLNFGASNAWAISPERSITGAPLLANDPHLEFMHPSVWLEASIDAPGYRVAGMTMPGFPGIGIGRTPHIAWGLTAGAVSQIMLYEEQFNADETQVKSGERWSPVHYHDEIIRVRGQQDEFLRIRTTPRGPLVSDLHPDLCNGPVSLHWTGAEVSNEFRSLLDIPSASSITDLLELRDRFSVPAFNMAVADDSGNIALIGLGRYPIQQPKAGVLSADQFPPEYVPLNCMPLEINPERGWVACANNRIVGNDFPYPVRGLWDPGYRARRIGQVLEVRRKHSVAEMRALQLDQYSIRASELVPHIVDLICGDAPEWVLDDLRNWDYNVTAESRPALLFHVFDHFWMPASLRHLIPSEIVDRMVEPIASRAAPGLFTDRLLKGELPTWLDERNRRETAREALTSALVWIEDRLGPDIASWRWGTVHSLHFIHSLGTVTGPHRRRVNIGPFELGGDDTTVSPFYWDSSKPFDITAGPSMRFVTDLRDADQSWATNTLGQSGSIFSRHFRDQTEDYIRGRLHRIWPDKHSTDRIDVLFRPQSDASVG